MTIGRVVSLCTVLLDLLKSLTPIIVHCGIHYCARCIQHWYQVPQKCQVFVAYSVPVVYLSELTWLGMDWTGSGIMGLLTVWIWYNGPSSEFVSIEREVHRRQPRNLTSDFITSAALQYGKCNQRKPDRFLLIFFLPHFQSIGYHWSNMKRAWSTHWRG